MQPKHNKQLVPLAKQLRKEMTKEERHLWYDFLRSYPVRFSRQKVLGKYIADFYCAEAKLVIELDGSQHYEDRNVKKDADRTAFLEGYGLRVIRIPNNEVDRNFCGVCAYIDAAVKQSLSQLPLHKGALGTAAPVRKGKILPMTNHHREDQLFYEHPSKGAVFFVPRSLNYRRGSTAV